MDTELICIVSPRGLAIDLDLSRQTPRPKLTDEGARPFSRQSQDKGSINRGNTGGKLGPSSSARRIACDVEMK